LSDLRLYLLRGPPQVPHISATASNLADITTTGAPSGVAELTALLESWRLHPEAACLPGRCPATPMTAPYSSGSSTGDMPTAAAAIKRGHVEASSPPNLCARPLRRPRYATDHCSSSSIGSTRRARSTSRQWRRCASRSPTSSPCPRVRGRSERPERRGGCGEPSKPPAHPGLPTPASVARYGPVPCQLPPAPRRPWQ
jgi:hypothetical protein